MCETSSSQCPEKARPPRLSAGEVCSQTISRATRNIQKPHTRPPDGHMWCSHCRLSPSKATYSLFTVGHIWRMPFKNNPLYPFSLSLAPFWFHNSPCYNHSPSLIQDINISLFWVRDHGHNKNESYNCPKRRFAEKKYCKEFKRPKVYQTRWPASTPH